MTSLLRHVASVSTNTIYGNKEFAWDWLHVHYFVRTAAAKEYSPRKPCIPAFTLSFWRMSDATGGIQNAQRAVHKFRVREYRNGPWIFSFLQFLLLQYLVCAARCFCRGNQGYTVCMLPCFRPMAMPCQNPKEDGNFMGRMKSQRSTRYQKAHCRCIFAAREWLKTPTRLKTSWMTKWGFVLQSI